MMVILMSSATGVMEGVFKVGQVHQTTWIWCPYSWCPSGKTHFSPWWADGLERNWFWLFFLFFLPNGLEMRYCHSKWALNVLYFSCRLCHWDPGSRKSNHNPRFQSVPVIHVMGAVPCLFGKNCACSLTLRTHRSLPMWALSNCSFCLSWISMGLCQIWCMLIVLDGLEITATCAGHPWTISGGEGRSADVLL